MDEQKYTAFSLKYQGKTYKEISEDKRVKLSKATLETYLAPDGAWGPEYRAFCKERNKNIETSVVSIFKGVAEVAADAMIDALKEAMSYVKQLREVIETYDTLSKEKNSPSLWDLKRDLARAQERVVFLSEKVLDRSGLPIIRKLEVEDNEDELTREELNEILKAAGIDAESLSYKSKAPARSD